MLFGNYFWNIKLIVWKTQGKALLERGGIKIAPIRIRNSKERERKKGEREREFYRLTKQAKNDCMR